MSDKEVIGYDMYEAVKDKRGIYHLEMIATYKTVNGYTEFLNANREKWNNGMYRVKPVYKPIDNTKKMFSGTGDRIINIPNLSANNTIFFNVDNSASNAQVVMHDKDAINIDQPEAKITDVTKHNDDGINLNKEEWTVKLTDGQLKEIKEYADNLKPYTPTLYSVEHTADFKPEHLAMTEKPKQWRCKHCDMTKEQIKEADKKIKNKKTKIKKNNNLKSNPNICECKHDENEHVCYNGYCAHNECMCDAFKLRNINIETKSKAKGKSKNVKSKRKQKAK